TLDSLGKVGTGPLKVYYFNSKTVSDQKSYDETGSNLYEIEWPLLIRRFKYAGYRGHAPQKERLAIQNDLDKHGNHEGVQNIAFTMGT
ncbi:hypothetical protein ASPBRDRAFT_660158, partial [Aspergillus brasiliensis CBS 101740]